MTALLTGGSSVAGSGKYLAPVAQQLMETIIYIRSLNALIEVNKCADPVCDNLKSDAVMKKEYEKRGKKT